MEELKATYRSGLNNAKIAEYILFDMPDSHQEVALHIARSCHAYQLFFQNAEESQNKKGKEGKDLSARLKRFGEGLERTGVSFPKELPKERWLADVLKFQNFQEGIVATDKGALEQDTLEAHIAFLFAIDAKAKSLLYEITGEGLRKYLKPTLISIAVLAILLGLYGAVFGFTKKTWRVYYYDNTELKGSPIDSGFMGDIKFNWAAVPPSPLLSTNDFSARMISCVDVPKAMPMEIELGTDDGGRFFVDGSLVIDSWVSRPIAWDKKTVELSKGVHILEINYYQGFGGAEIGLKLNSKGKNLESVSGVKFRPASMSESGKFECDS